MAGPSDEQRLIEACRAGSTESFGELVRRYESRLYPAIFRVTGRAEDARDVLQEAFFRAFRKLDRFQGESAFYTWVYRIAINLALSGRRRRRDLGSLDDRRAVGIDLVDEASRSDPSLPLERAERDAKIQRALNELPGDFRAAVVLKDLEGLRYEEIAEILNIPVGTVRSRIHRGRSELKKTLRELVEETPASAGVETETS